MQRAFLNIYRKGRKEKTLRSSRPLRLNSLNVLYCLIWLIGMWGMVGCQQTAVSTPTPPPTTTSIALVATTTFTAVPPSATPSSTVTPIPTNTPTSTPTATPKPLVILAVPPQWAAQAETAVSQLATTSYWAWELLQDDDPAAQLANKQAHIALVNTTDGLLVRQEPIALTVPFTYDWYEATDEEAQRILAGTHPIAQAMPWSQMTPNLKTLRLHGLIPSEPGYPLQDSWSLVVAAGWETAVSEIAPLLQTSMAALPVIQMAAVGDIMLDRSLGYVIQEQNSPQYPFFNVAPILTAADITVGNLECALGDIGEPAPKRYTFQAPPEAVTALQLGGFDVISLANNHAMDYGPEALLQGISLLQQGNIAPIGAGANLAAARAPYLTQVNGLTMAFLGYVDVPIEASTHFDTETWTATDTAPGLAWARPEWITEDVTAVRPAADLVVVVLHSGLEYIDEPGEEQMAAAKAAIDAGADIVIGHHAHILQGIEFYNGGVIVYGLGNFAFEIDGNPSTAILNVWLDPNGVRQLELIPAIIQYGGQPRLAEPWEAGPILAPVYSMTAILNANN